MLITSGFVAGVISSRDNPIKYQKTAFFKDTGTISINIETE
jgi:hypothetical protein